MNSFNSAENIIIQNSINIHNNDLINNSDNKSNNIININNNINKSNVCNKSKRIKLSCGICNKKLPIFAIKCKCNKNYCSIHRYPNEHDCKYDYQSEFKNQLRNNNKKIKTLKVEII